MRGWVFSNCTLAIFCKVTSQPSEWSSSWNQSSNCIVIWGYVAEEYTYTLVSNYEEEIEPITTTLAISLPELTREGYHFMGWYDNSEFSGDPITNNVYYSTVNHTLYAKWLTEEEFNAIPDGTSFEKAYPLNVGETLPVVITTKNQRVYYKFTAPEAKTYKFKSIGSLDTYAYLYDENQTYIKTDDNGAGSRQFQLSKSMSVGETVYIAVALYSSSGTFKITATT
jgi:uncharacterized repeat protein (TIGR02543 family)